MNTEEDQKPELWAFPSLPCWCEVRTAKRRDVCLEAKGTEFHMTVTSSDAAARLRRERTEPDQTSSGAEL